MNRMPEVGLGYNADTGLNSLTSTNVGVSMVARASNPHAESTLKEKRGRTCGAGQVSAYNCKFFDE